MNEIESIDFIKHIEHKYPVEVWTINGVHIWPLVRSRIAFYNRHRGDRSLKHNSYLNKFKNFYTQITILKEIIKYKKYKFIKNKECKDVLIFHNNDVRNIKLLDGTYYDRFLDPVQNYLVQHNIRVLPIEQVHFNMKNAYRAGGSLDLYTFLILIYNRIFPYKYNAYLPQYENFLTYMDYDLANSLSIKEIIKQVSCIERISTLYKKILLKNGIKIVVFSCWYDTYRYAWSLACHELGLVAIDVQHGRAGSTNHDHYTGWTKFPYKKKYEIMPNIFMTWTEKDKAAIDSWQTKAVSAFCCGKGIFLDINNIKKKMDLGVLNNIPRDKDIILVSLQWGTTYPDWFVEYISSHADKYIWLVRYHPHLDDGQLFFSSKLKGIKNVYIDGIDNIMLEILLQNIVVHITMSSSVVVDAAIAGKKSVVLNQQFKETFSYLTEQGKVFFAENSNELSQKIESIVNESHIKEDMFLYKGNRDYRTFWENILGKKLIDSII